MTKRNIAILLFVLMLIIHEPSSWSEIVSQASPQAFEGIGPVLQSRIVMQSSPATFIKKKVILPSYQNASDKIECPVPEDSDAFGTFSPPEWTNLYWTTRDYQSPLNDGFTLFSNEVFQIRYTPFVGGDYFRINSTYPQMRQNFTVPLPYDNFEVKYVWLVVRVYSGSAKLTAAIWNYGMISIGVFTESVTVTGPYDWWVAMKMSSPRTLRAGETYRLEVICETGSLDVRMISDFKDEDDNAQGNVSFYNTTSGNMEDITGRMLEGVLTYPVDNTYLTSFATWSRALPLQSYRLYLHGRNIPRSSIVMRVNSLPFGTGEVPEVRLTYPLDESAFWIPIQGSRSFSGGTVEISSDLISIEQSRPSYDKDHPPPFHRPFASLKIFTDNAGKPWGEWAIGGGKWEAYVKDAYGNLYALPADRVEQMELHQKAVYPLFFYPPVSPSYGFLDFTVRFNYTIEASSQGPEFNSSYSVSPSSNALWNVSNPLFSFVAPSYSSILIKIGPVPTDWVIREAFVTPGAGGGTPFVSIVNNYITIDGIVMGASDTYSGGAEIRVKADNYLETQAAYIRFRWTNVFSSFFLQNDVISVEARAASTIPSFPPGVVSISVIRPPAIFFDQSLNQFDQNGVTTRNISLVLNGLYSVSVTYKSSDGLRVGASRASFKVLGVFAAIDKDRVLLSLPMVILELNSSDVSLISSAKFVLTAPNSSTKTIIFDQAGDRFFKEISFPQTDPSVIGNWSIFPLISFPNGIERQLPPISFLILDDIPPIVSNITQSPREATFMEEVNISCIVIDKGVGVRSVWISYSSGNVKRNITAKPIGPRTYSAVIPRQPPFATVSYAIYVVDYSGNIGASGTFTYTVGIPLWLSIILILALVAAVLIVALYLKRRISLPPLPPPPPTP